MFTLFKYEMRGRYKGILGVCGVIILWSLYLFTIYDGGWRFINIILFYLMSSSAVLVGVFISGVNLFMRDLYQDTDYLVFSLPRKAYATVGSKLLTSLVDFIIFSFLSGSMVLIHVLNFQEFSRHYLLEAMNQLWPEFIYVYLYLIIILLAALIIAYFALTLGKAAFSNSRFGLIVSFGVFIISVILINKIHLYLTKVFPYNLMLHIGTVVNEINGQHISTIPVTVSVNVAGLIFEVLVHLCLFIVTLYLLDNKVDI